MAVAHAISPRPDRDPAAIRVMIVDDSLVARTMLARMLNEDDRFVIAGEAGNAKMALDKLAHVEADIILLDLEMPGQNGLAALPAMIEAGRGARVLVLSAACAEGADVCVSALRLGAADTLLKPQAGHLAGRFAAELRERLCRVAVIGAPAPIPPAPRQASATLRTARPVACIGIGASTGGVHALGAFFASLPPACRAPILVTQHLPEPFMVPFAGQLAEMAQRPTRLAVSGMPLVPGEMILAPGNAHLTLIRVRDRVHVKLDRRPAPSGCLPSVDPMFASLAEIYQAEAVGVVLSGMGRDGLIGAHAIVEAGGAVLAQDAASSVVWGMPGVVAKAKIAQAVLPPAEIARCIGAWTAEQTEWK
jgi:two-component system chemotaxis response regulator CheB